MVKKPPKNPRLFFVSRYSPNKVALIHYNHEGKLSKNSPPAILSTLSNHSDNMELTFSFEGKLLQATQIQEKEYTFEQEINDLQNEGFGKFGEDEMYNEQEDEYCHYNNNQEHMDLNYMYMHENSAFPSYDWASTESFNSITLA